MGLGIINKKGIFFTSIVIVIFILFLIGFTIFDQVKERKTIHQRISTMNNFLFSAEQDLQRQVYTTGFRIIFLYNKKIIESGSYITNFNSTNTELFMNSSLYGTSQDLMVGSTFSDIQTSLQQKASKINANISLTFQNFEITQDDPWHVKVILTTKLLMNDNSNLVIWNKTETTTSYINVENFEDPLYPLNTGGLIINKINKTRYYPLVNGTNVGNLSSHAANSFYVNSTDAPSFLDRIQGINAGNQNGIESIVNTQKLSTQGITVLDKSVVDHIYFSANNPSTSQITGMPSWFKIDEAHVDLYQARHLSTF